MSDQRYGGTGISHAATVADLDGDGYTDIAVVAMGSLAWRLSDLSVQR